MSSRFGSLLLLPWLACAGACGTSPDVVAEGQEDGTGGGFSTPGPEKEACEPGTYEGLFSGFLTGGTPLNGQIRFVLVSRVRGEFEVLASEFGLLGQTDSAIEFEAQVDSVDQCREGTFSSTLSGHFRLGDTTVDFSGPIEGEYDLEQREFSEGKWKVDLVEASTPLGSGQWNALRKESP